VELGNRLGFTAGVPDPWYGLTSAVLKKHGGRSMLNVYKGRVASMLMESFPDFDWLVWKFKKLPSVANQSVHITKALRHLEAKYVRSPEDWCRISKRELDAEGLSLLISKAGGLRAVLQLYSPSLPSMHGVPMQAAEQERSQTIVY